MRGTTGRPGFHLLDAAALVVGYGLASMLIRAYWPASETPRVFEAAVIGLVFLWLGLAVLTMAVIARAFPIAAGARGPTARAAWTAACIAGVAAAAFLVVERTDPSYLEGIGL